MPTIFWRVAHTRGEAWATQPLIYLPMTASKAKVDKLSEMGAQPHFHSQDGVDAENHARAEATRCGQVYVSPYNDVQVSVCV